MAEKQKQIIATEPITPRKEPLSVPCEKREGTDAPIFPSSQTSELDILRAEIAELRQQLAAKTEADAKKPAIYRGEKKLYRVSLAKHIAGFETPSPWFAKEYPAQPERQGVNAKGEPVTIAATPADPRGLPIEAYDADQARAIFYRLHGIEGGGPLPEVTEMDPAEIVAPEPAAEDKRKRVPTEKNLDKVPQQHRAAQAAAAG